MTQIHVALRPHVSCTIESQPCKKHIALCHWNFNGLHQICKFLFHPIHHSNPVWTHRFLHVPQLARARLLHYLFHFIDTDSTDRMAFFVAPPHETQRWIRFAVSNHWRGLDCNRTTIRTVCRDWYFCHHRTFTSCHAKNVVVAQTRSPDISIGSNRDINWNRPKRRQRKVLDHFRGNVHSANRVCQLSCKPNVLTVPIKTPRVRMRVDWRFNTIRRS
mmetsp:Transcript_140/g.243  ORF Transcript_140/g.243 Transcript_140/m.243 type:complete len:217 (-) Transcript_140:680-1330(-)